MTPFELNIAEGVVAAAPVILGARGIGSCVILALYDPAIRAGGMAHILLPHGGSAVPSTSVFQYADTALAGLLEVLSQLGTRTTDLVAKIAGGGRMFAFDGNPGIGEQNVACLRGLLKSRGIPLIGEDVGGNNGRSVRFELDTGRLIVSMLDRMEREL